MNPFIRLYARGSAFYLIGETPFAKKTNNPTFNSVFEFEFFRATTLIFEVVDHRVIGANESLGIAEVDITNFNEKTKLDVPINEQSGDAMLSIISIEIDLIPTTFPDQIQNLPKAYQLNSRLYVFATYDPPIPNCSQELPMPVEICSIFSNPHYKFYTSFSYNTSWELIGHSSLGTVSRGPSGPTQIHRINPKKLSNTFLQFFIQSSNYDGKVTLNFLLAPKDNKKVKEFGYLYTINSPTAKGKNNFIPFLLHTDEIVIKPNQIRSSSSYLSFDKDSIPAFYPTESIDFNSPPPSDFTRTLVSMIPQISPEISSYVCRSMMPLSEQVSYDLGEHHFLNLIVGGGFQTMDKECSVIWVHPQLLLFDKNTKEHLEALEKPFFHEGDYVSQPCVASNFNNRTKYKDQFCIHANLDSIGKDKHIILGIRIGTPSLGYVSFPVFVRIVAADTNKELFFTPIKVQDEQAAMIVCRFEFLDNSWQMFPVFRPIKNDLIMKTTAEIMNDHNWRHNKDDDVLADVAEPNEEGFILI